MMLYILRVLDIFLGLEYIDTVIITPSLVIPRQSIGSAEMADGFSGVDGILG